jgi:hypothetical protein
MNDVVVPEQVVLVLEAMHPITGKVEGDEGHQVSKPAGGHVGDSHALHQPPIGNDRHAQTQHVFRYVGNARAEAADHIAHRNGIVAFIPSPPLFEEHQHQKSRHGDEENFSVGFHTLTLAKLQKSEERISGSLYGG